MATKDLGRTPLEAGNTTEYHETRREVRRQSRHEAKAFCRNAARDPEFRDAMPAPVAPEHRRPGACWPSDMHADTIGPVKRWIHRQVGRLWDDVYSEIRSRFDVRTLAGRHIVEGHLLQYVALNERDRWLADLYVDGDGVLRERKNGFRKSAPVARFPVSLKALDAWLAGRKVGRRGSKLFWFVPVERYVTHLVRTPVWENGMLSHWRSVEFRERLVDRWCFRQDHPLTRDEVAFYERLPAWKQAEVAEGLPKAVVQMMRGSRPSDYRFYRIPAPGAPPLKIDDEAA